MGPKSKAQTSEPAGASGSGQWTLTSLARIEVGPAEMSKFLSVDTAAQVAVELKKIGYAHVTLDLQGYRRGSTNEVLFGDAAGKGQA